MINFKKAEVILNSIPVSPKSTRIPLDMSLDKVLAENIRSAINMPPFDKSAMDGFAISSTDMSEEYRILETIAAGQEPTQVVKPGTCSGIMTGAMVPKGADQVVKVEDTTETNGMIKIINRSGKKNICYQAEDIARGDLVLDQGTLITPERLAIIASMGYDQVPVFQPPVLGLLTTGSEIVEPGEPLGTGQIYNSNAYAVKAQAARMGLKIIYGGIVQDTLSETENQVGRIVEQADISIISGGVSMGRFDFVPEVLKKLGFTIHFAKVAVKPGKPTVFASLGEKFIFGLPGNPVSAFIIFEVLIKSFIYRNMGHEWQPVILTGKMENGYKGKISQRTRIIPVRYNSDGGVYLPEYHGSAHLHALATANGLLMIEPEVDRLDQGQIVNVRQL